MSDLNKWIGSGRVTRDSELRFTPGGTPVVDIGLCSNRSWSKDGERTESPTFLDVTLWGKQAEVLTQYLTKGTFIMVEGRLELDTWDAEDGSKRSKLRVVANQVNLGPKTTPSKVRVREGEENQEEVPF